MEIYNFGLAIVCISVGGYIAWITHEYTKEKWGW